MPLTAEQRTDIAQLGSEYEREYDELQSTYTEGTTRLEKLVDELELRAILSHLSWRVPQMVEKPEKPEHE